MNTGRIGFETLNAYVDGALDAAESAEVALAIAASPGLARQVAMITRLRSATIEAVEVPDIDIDVEIDPIPAGRTRLRMVAACISVLVLAAGSFLAATFLDHPDLPPWFDVVARAHDAWGDGEPSSASNTGISRHEHSRALAGIPVGTLAGPRAGPLAGAFVPDLSSAKLFAGHIFDLTDAIGGALLVIGYRGTRGCRVTLAVSADGDAFPAEKVQVRDGDRRAYAWRVGRLGYAVMAKGMDSSRYDLIVKAMYDATLRNRPLDPNTRIALGASRKRSAPCLA